MHLTSALTTYTKEQLNARQAQRLAEFIAFAPAVFQASRLIIKFGILDLIRDNDGLLTREDIVQKTGLSDYAVKCLLEASLSIGTTYIDPESERYFISKTGWFLLNDKAARVNMDFSHDVNYLGWYHLEESLLNGKPEGLKTFGNWPTVYQGLSQLPDQAKKSWFQFDHFYSDSSFDEAIEIVLRKNNVKKLYDIGGNTGKWALKCVESSNDVRVTVIDLPTQIEMLKENIKGKYGEERISGIGIDILDPESQIPQSEGGLDAIWMSQFLDCFSMEQIVDILKKAKAAMTPDTRIYIMETVWDRQRFEPASFCLTMTSLYFAAIANGNSKMYNTEDLQSCIEKAGLTIEEIYDNLGQGHSILKCKLNTK